MRIGLRASPHLEKLVNGIKLCGDAFSSTNDTGCDWWLAWGWPQARQVMRDGAPGSRIICVDAHPFSLMAGDRSGARILQLGNFGALAEYPPGDGTTIELPQLRHDERGLGLVIGQVYTRLQEQTGLVDVWHTPGFEAWAAGEMKKINRRFRPHPRMVAFDGGGEQRSLEEDLARTSGVLTWNSTAAVHARLLGYPQIEIPAEAHGWGHMDIQRLAGLRASPAALNDGSYWHSYREWLRV
jgi:hypothetical protein